MAGIVSDAAAAPEKKEDAKKTDLFDAEILAGLATEAKDCKEDAHATRLRGHGTFLKSHPRHSVKLSSSADLLAFHDVCYVVTGGGLACETSFSIVLYASRLFTRTRSRSGRRFFCLRQRCLRGRFVVVVVFCFLWAQLWRQVPPNLCCLARLATTKRATNTYSSCSW